MNKRKEEPRDPRKMNAVISPLHIPPKAVIKSPALTPSGSSIVVVDDGGRDRKRSITTDVGQSDFRDTPTAAGPAAGRR